MCDILEQNAKEGTFGKSWKNRFRDKWPTMTTLMHQSEITIDPYVHEYTDPHEIMAYQTCKIPDWDGSSQTSWSVARSIEHDILESKAPSSSDSAKQQRRCDKLCRNVLLTFLILSVVTAVVAAIGLSVFLTLHDNGFAKDKGHHHGNHIHPNITTEEEMYLSKIFCSLVKILLRNTDFPVETGLENCHTVLLLVENSQNLHIEMHVSPREGYTIKEKILRALAEGVLMGTNNRLKNKEIQTTVSVDDMKIQHSTMPVLSANESMPTTGQPVLSVKDSMPATSQPVLSVKDSMPTTSQPVLSVKDSMPTTGQPVLSVKDSMPTTGQPVLNVKDSMPTTGQPVLSVKDSMPTAGQPLLLTTNIDTVTDTKYHPYLPKGEKQSTELAVSQETSKSDNAMIYPNNAVVNKQNIPATLEPQYLSNTTNPTTLPPIILPHVTEPTVAVNVSDNGKYLYETTTTSAEVTSLYEFAGTFETTSRQSDVKTLAIQDSTRDSNGLKSTVKPNDKQSWQKTPVATKLFNPESINVKDTFVTENGNIEVQNERRNKSPKIVESLMAGGVMKLPFKTNSNFRFLFSSDSKVKTTNQKVFKKPGAVVKKKAVTDGRRFNELDNNYNANFNTQNDKFSGLETSQLYTEKPKSPDLFRTLRIPTSSTKSFMQRKAELPKKPKRTIDVTEFGDQSLIFSLT